MAVLRQALDRGLDAGRGRFQDRRFRSPQAIRKGGGDREEDDERRHHHFRRHAETEPEHQDGCQHEDRKGLQDKDDRPGKPAGPRECHNEKRNRRTENAACDETCKDFAQGDARVVGEEAALTHQCLHHREW